MYNNIYKQNADEIGQEVGNFAELKTILVHLVSE